MLLDRERITRALDLLTRGLFPYVEQEMKAVYRDKWHESAQSSFRDARGQSILKGDVIRWDVHALLTVMWDHWNRVFRHRLGPLERSLVSELREYRNRWAHQEAFNFDDAYRILDGIERLLRAAGSDAVDQVAREKTELLRRRFIREAKAAYRKSQLRKRQWLDFSVYAACCGSIIFVIFQYFGLQAWFVALFVMFVFGYLAWQRLYSQPPIFFGPHECDACGKIIYGETCPYCEVQPRLTTPSARHTAAHHEAERATAASSAEAETSGNPPAES